MEFAAFPSIVLVQPILNSVLQRLIILFNGEEFSNVEYSSFSTYNLNLVFILEPYKKVFYHGTNF